MACRAWRQLPDGCGDIGLGLKLHQQLFDLPLGAVSGPLEQLVSVARSQVRNELPDPAQVDASIGEHLEELWVFAARAGDADAEIRLVFGEMKHVPQYENIDGVASRV